LTSKKPNLIIKDTVRVEEKDYRGILAIILVSAWIIFLALDRLDAASAIGPFAGGAAAWWFTRRRRGRR